VGVAMESPSARSAVEVRPIASPLAQRHAQQRWSVMPIRERLNVVRRLRRLLADRAGPVATALTDAHPQRTNHCETLLAELLPVVDACRFLERRAHDLLRPRRLGLTGRPLWLAGVRSTVRREPFGIVLVIGPANYPFMLTAIPALQALAAGNAVVIKPAPHSGSVVNILADLLRDAGLPADLLRITGEGVADVTETIDAGVDKVVLTGSARTGRKVLAQLADRLVPATMELSGCDAVFVLPGANAELVARAVAMGMRLNGSATCIAPRRVFVCDGEASAVERQLRQRLACLDAMPVDPVAAEIAEHLVNQAVASGAERVFGGPVQRGLWRPTLITGASPSMRLLCEDVFVPVISVVRVDDVDEALRFNRHCPYALGASVFGPAAAAAAFAERVDAGSVTVNDLIVPTADPRLPFGGWRQSGFGVTRGGEGLLEMTRIKTVTVRGGRLHPHLDPPAPGDAEVAEAYLQVAHGSGVAGRLAGIRRLVRALLRRHRPATSETTR
jgi:acyl-CoA reductase-like NAD-dependent aldehyde dehydrogenase